MIIVIENAKLIKELIGYAKKFPKYTTQILNLANQNAQGTRPKVVGQLSELIKECPYSEYEKWKKWYLEKNPKAIGNATKKINDMVNGLKEAVKKIDESMVREWVEDLVLDKTFIGLKFQEVILKRVAEIKGKTYRLASPKEESKGIDGFVGTTPISIKPMTYKSKRALLEKIGAKIIFYEKIKGGIKVDSSELLTEEEQKKLKD